VVTSKNLLGTTNEGVGQLPSTSTTLSAVVSNQVLLCTAEVELVDTISNRKCFVKALLDNGSQSSFLSERVQAKLNIVYTKVNPISVCGVNDTTTNSAKYCNLKVRSKVNNFCIDVSCFVIPQITSCLPNVSVDISNIKFPPNICLADPTFFEPSEIDLLLGADVFWEIIKTDKIKLGLNQPILQDSTFGWLVAGPIKSQSNVRSKIHCNFSQEIRDSLAKFWELEELPASSNVLSKEDEECETHFVNTHKRLPDGRFSVKIPLREIPEESVGHTYSIVRKRFFSLENRLMKSKIKDRYTEFLQEYEDLGHLTRVSRPSFGYYIPHHAVLREQSETTKLRVVFNASFKGSSGKSLNDIMMVGPRVQDDLISILLRFRYHIYVVTGDIEKMYRQIVVDECQRHLQLILWRADHSQPLQTLQLNTVTYGTASAPFLSTRYLVQLANECPDDKIANIVRSDFYVDDLNTGASSKNELETILKGVIQVLNKGCFPLRKFRTNAPEIFSDLVVDNNMQDFCKESTILGLRWLPTTDTLFFCTNFEHVSKVTKRNILSTFSKLFDPLGLLSPYIVTPKLIIQELWRLKLRWDDPVPNEIKVLWESFVKDHDYICKIKIPRCVMSEFSTEIELHCFTDASQKAYACCIYVRSKNKVSLLCARSKVAPLRSEITIPRLELLGALLGARLYSKVIKSLKCSVTKSIFWSDSTIVLCWLKRQPKTLKPYICNRVEEIQQLTDISNWRHVPTDANPADLGSRGVSPRQLERSSLWWHGPPFLTMTEDQWPKNSYSCVELPEVRVSLNIRHLENVIPFENYSNYNKLLRVTAYVLRFIKNCKHNTTKVMGILTASELEESMMLLVKLSQYYSFPSEIHLILNSKGVPPQSKILSLNPFINQGGVLRVGGRIGNATPGRFAATYQMAN
jgi:hypothetical protein